MCLWLKQQLRSDLSLAAVDVAFEQLERRSNQGHEHHFGSTFKLSQQTRLNHNQDMRT